MHAPEISGFSNASLCHRASSLGNTMRVDSLILRLANNLAGSEAISASPSVL